MSNYVPTNGLVGWWPFNGNANDESGNNNNGTVNGAALTSDRFGNANSAYSFNSSSSNFVKFNTPSNNNVTICGWYKCPTPVKYYPRIFFYGSGSSQSAPTTFLSAWIMGSVPSWITNNFTGRFYNETNVINSAVNQNLITSDNNWHHFAVTINNNAIITTYIDGQLAMTNSLNNNVAITNGQLYIGRDPVDNYAGSTQGRFDGLIDDVGLFNRSLTQQEITDLYNANICYQTVTVTDTLIINTNLVGFNPITYQNTIKIFPNPTSDHITINYGNFATLNGYQLKIINSLGQQMFQTAINQQSNYISLASWTGNGIYFVHIIDPQGNTIDIRKIVLQ